MILDKINTESSVANRAMMADYLDAKRFAWVFFVDSFMWPFNNDSETARNADEEVYIPLQEKMLHRWMQQERRQQTAGKFWRVSRNSSAGARKTIRRRAALP